tara:strand:+ start:9113 stop:9478 length:366 start_codon:yes stop_codon:yes gene_type:complete
MVTGQGPGDIESGFISDEALAGVDVDYFRHLITQIPRYQRELEDRLQAFADRPLDRTDPVERAIVLIGAYEILFRPDIPPKAAIDQAVEVAHVFGAQDSYRFVNGLLDRLAADRLAEGDTG